jgi:hypothetical protein
VFVNGLLVAFLIAHSVVHLAIWALPMRRHALFDATDSWLIGVYRVPALILAITAAALLTTGGVALWLDTLWWKGPCAAGLLTSALLLFVYFDRWFLPMQMINLWLLLALVAPSVVGL